MGRSKDWNFTPQATTFLRFGNCCQENVTTLCCVTVLTLAFGISGLECIGFLYMSFTSWSLESSKIKIRDL